MYSNKNIELPNIGMDMDDDFMNHAMGIGMNTGTVQYCIQIGGLLTEEILLLLPSASAIPLLYSTQM